MGSRVVVPFGRQKKIGIVMQHKTHADVPENKIKSIIKILDGSDLLNEDMIQLYRWCHHYYKHPIGDITIGTLPKKLREISKRIQPTLSGEAEQPHHKQAIKDDLFLTLNAEQQSAYDKISINSFQISLLDGVTGSGKTEIYMHLIRSILKQHKQVLVLVPEIGLTPQTQQRFEQRFPGQVATIHSQLTEKQKLSAWQSAHRGHASIILGTRSAVFADMAHLGAIIIDEEHDHSFKQQEGFRYHARHVAIMRAKFNQIPIILGSATPSVDTLYNAMQGKYQHLTLSQRAGKATLPHIELIQTNNDHNQHGLSPKMQAMIQEHLDKKQQILIFLNRRGYSQVIYCPYCGWTCQCKNCDARMTLHRKNNIMRCHHCNYQHAIPKQCDHCSHPDLLYLGEGTEKIEEQVTALFQHYRIIRLDSDTMKYKGNMQAALDQIHNNQVDIIIGTQMIAKGHHFANCGMVAIVNMDQCLFSANFRNIEYGGQLILQIAGRSGRENHTGKVYVQTACANHPYLQPLIKHDYHQFYHIIMQERQTMQLPPLVAWAYIQARSKDKNKAIELLNTIKQWLCTHANNNLSCHGPAVSAMARKADWYQAQLCIQAPNKTQLQHIYAQLIQHAPLPANNKNLRWYLDIDPMH